VAMGARAWVADTSAVPWPAVASAADLRPVDSSTTAQRLPAWHRTVVANGSDLHARIFQLSSIGLTFIAQRIVLSCDDERGRQPPADFARQSLVANFQYLCCDARDSVRSRMRPVHAHHRRAPLAHLFQAQTIAMMTMMFLAREPRSGWFYETRVTPGGCHVPAPAGKIDGCVVFGQ
jgi:hypothetical protein